MISKQIALIVFFLAAAAFTGPRFSVDTKEYKYGEVNADKKEKIKAVFIIKNTGNKDLKIERVKKSCGCTDVEYDTVIPPGKTGKLIPTIRVRGFSAGPMKKYVTVYTNDEKNSEVRLTVHADLIMSLSASQRYLHVGPDNNKENPVKIVLNTDKPDLRIKDIMFNETSKDKRQKWQPDVPLFIDFYYENEEPEPKGDGRYEYILNIFYEDTIEYRKYGNFIINSDHPQKPKLVIRGKME